MSWKNQSVSMPMTSAGIFGMGSSDSAAANIHLDPKSIVIFSFIFIIIVKIISTFLV